MILAMVAKCLQYSGVCVCVCVCEGNVCVAFSVSVSKRVRVLALSEDGACTTRKVGRPQICAILAA